MVSFDAFFIAALVGLPSVSVSGCGLRRDHTHSGYSSSFKAMGSACPVLITMFFNTVPSGASNRGAEETVVSISNGLGQEIN